MSQTVKPLRIVIASARAFLKRRHPAKLGHEGDERVFQQPALFEILNQCGARLVENRAMHVVLCLERLVAVPVSDAFAHRVRAVEKLHEAHAAFDESPREHAIAREAGFQFVAVIHAVHFECGGALLFEVGDFRGAELHLRREFVARDACAQFAIAGMSREMSVVEHL